MAFMIWNRTKDTQFILFKYFTCREEHMVAEGEDEEGRPMTTDELRVRAMKGVSLWPAGKLLYNLY